MNIRELVVSCCGWEDKIPDQYRSVWLSNFELMEIIGDLVYNRAVVPADASSLDVELISAGDASEQMACACCYIRFKRKDNSYSCQLLLDRAQFLASLPLPDPTPRNAACPSFSVACMSNTFSYFFSIHGPL